MQTLLRSKGQSHEVAISADCAQPVLTWATSDVFSPPNHCCFSPQAHVPLLLLGYQGPLVRLPSTGSVRSQAAGLPPPARRSTFSPESSGPVPSLQPASGEGSTCGPSRAAGASVSLSLPP